MSSVGFGIMMTKNVLIYHGLSSTYLEILFLKVSIYSGFASASKINYIRKIYELFAMKFNICQRIKIEISECTPTWIFTYQHYRYPIVWDSANLCRFLKHLLCIILKPPTVLKTNDKIIKVFTPHSHHTPLPWLMKNWIAFPRNHVQWKYHTHWSVLKLGAT